MRRKVKIRQLDKYDCAAACLASVASYYGIDTPVTLIREKCGTNIEGTNIKGIIEAASYLNIEARAFKSTIPCYTITQFSDIPTPSILLFKRQDHWLHFVVLYKINKKRVIIMDPSDGEFHPIDEKELSTRWTGHLITLTPTPDFTKGDRRTPFLDKIWNLIQTNKSDLLSALIGSIVYVLIGLSTSLSLQLIIDRIIPERETESLAVLSIGILALILLSLFIGYIRTIFIIRGGLKIDALLIMKYINHILHLPLSFFNTRTTGDINARIGDAYKIRSFISSKLILIFISVLSIIISFALLFSYYWKLALIAIAYIPLYAGLYCYADRSNKKHNKGIIEASAAFEGCTIDTISSIESIQYFSSQEYFSKRIEKIYTSLSRKLYLGSKNNAHISLLSEALTHSLSFIIIIIGAGYVLNSHLSIGELVSFFTIASFFTSPVAVLIESTNEITEAKVAAQRLFEILDLEREDSPGPAPIHQENYFKDIVFDNVHFKYPGQKELFNGLSFTAPKGKITTIIGRNGSGKSTLASMLMRSITPTSGAIFLDNTNIAHIDLQDWRDKISIIPQHIRLFDSTILDNITMGDTGYNIDKVLGICEMVGMIDFIKKLPKGLLSDVGEGGRLLSGGEKGKIALARALYKESQILIMDEVTSSLDETSALKIYTLSSILAQQGKTIINITHDKMFLPYSDKIINIDTSAHEKGDSHPPICGDTDFRI